MTFKAIGYWREPTYVWLPDERRFNFEGWSEDSWLADPMRVVESHGGCDPDPLVVSYLRSGKEFAAWRGFSSCRFECGVPDELMGYRCLTDGAWVWPEGLAHYVERHQLPLPDEFTSVTHAHHGQVPDAALPDSSLERSQVVDRSFWNDWYRALTS